MPYIDGEADAVTGNSYAGTTVLEVEVYDDLLCLRVPERVCHGVVRNGEYPARVTVERGGSVPDWTILAGTEVTPVNTTAWERNTLARSRPW